MLSQGAVTLRWTEVDVTATIDQVTAQSGLPGRLARAEEYLPAVNSEAGALTVFAPRDGLRT